ncbi:MAG: class I SAM-dependent methyltransferase [Actinobacteria bacterium]|nr:class I SAM-dependent methyltransferase [Actinomycetota bacterium]
MTVTETEPDTERVAGFALLGSLGKRVLRPGGAELTTRLLDELAIGPDDDVVEIAPGRGRTARLILEHRPASYVGIDRDPAAQRSITPLLHGPRQRFLLGSVARTGLDDGECSVAVGEAVLTMHPRSTKAQIVAELARVVRPGGRIGLHEVAFQLHDTHHDVDNDTLEQTRIRTELTSHFRVSFNAMTMADWTDLLAEAGFMLATVHRAPLRLLEPDRIIADEGVVGAARFAANVLADPRTRARIAHMRAAMRRNAPSLRAVAMVAVRTG